MSIDATGVVIVTFDASEAGSLTVALGRRPMACGPRSAVSPNHTCTRTMVGNEIPVGTEEGQPVVVTLRDLAGNVASAVGSMVFDFRATDLLPGSVAMELTPAAGSLVLSIDALRAGARIRISFTVVEPLAATPVVSTSPQALAFGVASQAGPFYVLEHQLDASAHPQGAYTLQLQPSSDR